MNITKIARLAASYRDAELQIEDLKIQMDSIEAEFTALIETETIESPAPRSRKRSKRKTTKRASRRKGVHRNTPAGDEIKEIEARMLEHFKANPDKEISCDDLYEAMGSVGEVEQSRTRNAVLRLKKSLWLSVVRRGVYALQPNRGGGNLSATEDEAAVLKAMAGGGSMRSKEILDAVDPPSYRRHALQNRIWLMSKNGKITQVDRGVYKLNEAKN